jgi:hypothetical protein
MGKMGAAEVEEGVTTEGVGRSRGRGLERMLVLSQAGEPKNRSPLGRMARRPVSCCLLHSRQDRLVDVVSRKNGGDRFLKGSWIIDKCRNQAL